MVDRWDMELIALRYDTAMSRAMLRALGSKRRPRHARKPGVRPLPRRHDPYEGMREAFENRGRSPVEWQ